MQVEFRNERFFFPELRVQEANGLFNLVGLRTFVCVLDISVLNVVM